MPDPLRYGLEIDPHRANDAHTYMLDMIGRHKRVLEFGASAGAMTRVLASRGCEVVAVEVDEVAAAHIGDAAVDVIVGDAADLDMEATLGADRFDVVVFGDVLEHLVDPLPVLARAARTLVPQGSVVASIPNVAHAAVRLALLAGRFQYTPVGLLDQTHVRFFTRDSIHDLMQDAGLVIVETRRTSKGPFETEIPLDANDYAPEVLSAVLDDAEASTYQFVVRAVLDGRDEALRQLSRREHEQQDRLLRLGREVADLQQQLSQSHARTQELHDALVALHRDKAEADQRVQDLHDMVVALNESGTPPARPSRRWRTLVPRRSAAPRQRRDVV
jgi:2-polyprenyl-3-methyl-5-hydroxy-6-metoxy-1,4-benzoquinol methylase